MFLLLAIVLLFLLPAPWGIVAALTCMVLFIGEVAFWHRRVRGQRARAGAETLIGARAVVVTVCQPDGQVRLRGEIWEAQCAEGAVPGDEVVVTARDDLRLVVKGQAARV
jgi:membrane protein implicated in regulation of membrane protease activity